MIFVSMRFPEEIPWFKASRRAVVAAMSASGLEERHLLSIVFIVFAWCNRSARLGLGPQDEAKRTAVVQRWNIKFWA
jgi:hypothetical protein